MSTPASDPTVTFTVPIREEYQQILTPDAVAFVSRLSQRFEPRRQELLRRREQRQREIESGAMPDFLAETRSVREGGWTVAPIPPALLDRRVEITGPVERKMLINALNCGAPMFMADLEDSNSPTWDNNLQGQVNLRDAAAGTISFDSPEGKQYRLNAKVATLLVRPRGWHLVEKHCLEDGKPVSGSLFDFGLYFFHNAATLLSRGAGPYFYLPKMESHLEARLWNDVFVFAQQECGIPQGSIRATVLIETILASFEMDEILYELRDHSAGLNCGRWDYIFSFIKKFAHRPDFVMPNRAQVTMTQPFMNAYVELLIHTCHRRGIHAMGGMAAQIPIKNDPTANEAAIEKVRQDKLREVKAGHDGTWVAHPGLVPVAMEIFNQHMPMPNQIHLRRDDVQVKAADLLRVPAGDITEEGVRVNVDVGLQYLEAWLRGNGCVPIYNLMEDAATAEISRSQLWQWVHHGAKMSDRRPVTADLVKQAIDGEVAKRSASGKFAEAGSLFREMIDSPTFPEFLTLRAYERIA